MNFKILISSIILDGNLQISFHKSMLKKFTIRHIVVDGPHTAVKAQLASPRTGVFTVGQGSRLGGVRIKSFLGEDIASSLFTFQIDDPMDAVKFRVGDTVDLIE